MGWRVAHGGVDGGEALLAVVRSGDGTEATVRWRAADGMLRMVVGDVERATVAAVESGFDEEELCQ